MHLASAVVRAAYGVEVEFLHQAHIVPHPLDPHHVPIHRVVLMTVHTGDGHGHAVHQETAVAYLDGS
jgi:hypothetical protein